MGERGLRVALIGATGAVGGEILQVLHERSFPVAELLAYASEDSAGERVDFQEDEVVVPIGEVDPAVHVGSVRHRTRSNLRVSVRSPERSR